MECAAAYLQDRLAHVASYRPWPPWRRREGDLILLYDHGIVSRIIGPFNANWSHVVSASEREHYD